MIRPFEEADRPLLHVLGFDDEQIDDAHVLLVALDGKELAGARDLRVMGRGDEPVLILETRGRGQSAEALFAAILPAAATVLAAGGRDRAVLQARCTPEDAAARALFEAHGLTQARELWTMEHRDPGSVAEPSLPADVVVRAYAPGQHDEQWRIAFNDAFSDHFGGWMQMAPGAWQRSVGQPTFRPELSLVAWAGAEIAGFCHCRLDEPGRGMVRYVGVRPRWRRRGLGEALTRLGLRRLHAAGAAAVTLGVDATNTTNAHVIYQRLGFVVIGRNLMYRRDLCASSSA